MPPGNKSGSELSLNYFYTIGPEHGHRPLRKKKELLCG